MATDVPVEYEEQLDQSSVAAEKPFVIAFINLKSGSGKGDEIYDLLKDEIGEDNIFIFGKDKPADVIARTCVHPDSRVIVCGGDGSVNWILSIIDHLQLENVSVGIIPNGTGNDTSRYLGWGQRQFGSKSVKSNIKLMCQRRCPIQNFDRWQIFFSLNKERMQKRNARLSKTKEIPTTHLWALIDEDKTTGKKEEYLLPKFYKCMLRLDELDFLQRFKYLHRQHYPEEYRQSLCTYKDGTYVRSPNPALYPEGVLPEEVIRHEQQRNKYRELIESESKWLRFTWSFNNYLSLGLDAQVMNDFGIHRDNNPCCYQCRCCTMMWIGACSAATCLQCKKKPLKYRIDLLYKEGDILPVGQTMDAQPQLVVPHPLEDDQEVKDPKNKNNNNNNNNNNTKKQQQQEQQATPEGQDVEIQVEVDDIATNSSALAQDEITQLKSLNWADKDEKRFLQDPQYLANNYKWLSATFDPMQFGALVLLNIPSYAGGVNIWGDKNQKNKKNTNYILEDSAQSTDDGKLETVGFTGFINMQFIVTTQSAAYRITQLQGLRIYMNDDAYIQLDGEAFIQPQGILEIYRSQSGKMLQNPNADYPKC